MDAGTQTDTVLGLAYSGKLIPNIKAKDHGIFWVTLGHQRGQGHPKSENIGKLAKTCGELKISFSKFPYIWIFQWTWSFCRIRGLVLRCNVFTCIKIFAQSNVRKNKHMQ